MIKTAALLSLLIACACSVVVDPEGLQQGCAAGTKPCEVAPGELRCVSVEDPAYGCARESCVPCTLLHAEEVCDTSGQCAIGACLTDYENCDLSARTGCEIDTSSDYDNCGRCGATCDAALRDMDHTLRNQCVSGRCVVLECEDGWVDCDLAGTNGCETEGAVASCR